jgi:phage gpG-like protein
VFEAQGGDVYTSPALGFSDLKGFELHVARTWADHYALQKIQGKSMRKILWTCLSVVMALSALRGYAQSPNYDVGQVWRVTYYHIKPGQSEAFWKDFRENLKPVYEEAKKQGLLTGYKVWNNVTTDRPDDWDVAVATIYPNFAAIDQIDAKAATITIKHFGSREAMLEAAKKRSDIRDVVASKLAREVTPK